MQSIVKEKRVRLFIGVITIMVACLPLFRSGLLAGHDIWYHLLRIENLKIGMEEGVVPVKIGAMYLNYYGYGVSLCYPDLFLYFPAFLRMLGVGIMESYKCYLAGTVILCYLTAYYSGKKISGDSNAATITAILYSLCQYHICTLHIRDAVGEIQAFVFIPLVIFGLYDLIFSDFEYPFVMGLGFWGLMMCHSISLVIALCISVTVVLLKWKNVLPDRKKMGKLILTAAVTLLASIGFWLPFLEQLASNTFYFSHPWADVEIMALDWKTLFSVNRDTYNFGIPFLALTAAGMVLGEKQLRKEERSRICWFLWGGIVLLWASTRYFPWKILKIILNSIQFPFRLYSWAAMFLSIGTAILLYRAINAKRAVILALVVMSASSLLIYHYDTTEEVHLEASYYDQAYNSFNVYYKEWLPDNVDIELLKGDRLIQNADGSMTECVTEKSGAVHFYPKEGNQYYDVPLVWYKGYYAETVLGDGKRIELEVTESEYNGLIRVIAGSQMGEEIVVYYKGTMIQTVAGLLNILTIICLAAVCLRRRFLDGKKNKVLAA